MDGVGSGLTLCGCTGISLWRRAPAPENGTGESDLTEGRQGARTSRQCARLRKDCRPALKEPFVKINQVKDVQKLWVRGSMLVGGGRGMQGGGGLGSERHRSHRVEAAYPKRSLTTAQRGRRKADLAGSLATGEQSAE